MDEAFRRDTVVMFAGLPKVVSLVFGVLRSSSVLLVGVLDIHDCFDQRFPVSLRSEQKRKGASELKTNYKLESAGASEFAQELFLICQPSHTRKFTISMISVDGPYVTMIEK